MARTAAYGCCSCTARSNACKKSGRNTRSNPRIPKAAPASASNTSRLVTAVSLGPVPDGFARTRASGGEGADVAAPRARATRTPVAAAAAPRAGLRSVSVAAALPSGRSLLVGFGLVAVGVYVGVRQPSVFAVRDARVEGASPALARRVEHQLASVRGHSLVTLDGD